MHQYIFQIIHNDYFFYPSLIDFIEAIIPNVRFFFFFANYTGLLELGFKRRRKWSTYAKNIDNEQRKGSKNVLL